jgi:hypothetical protein
MGTAAPPGARHHLWANDRRTAMNLKSALTAGALAACAALATGTASAQQTATASLNNFHYQLIDLNTSDGITPYISFSAGSSAHAGAYLFDNFDQTFPAVTQDVLFSHGEVFTSNANGAAHAFSFADQVHSDVQIGYLSGLAESFTLQGFTLSPNTLLVFSADASVESSFNRGEGVGYAMAQLSGGYSVSDTNSVSFDSSLLSNPGEGLFSTTLSTAITSGNAELTGWVNYSTEANAVSYVSAVPEPASLGMLVAGLGMLTGVARRRNRHGRGA